MSTLTRRWGSNFWALEVLRDLTGRRTLKVTLKRGLKGEYLKVTLREGLRAAQDHLEGGLKGEKVVTLRGA